MSEPETHDPITPPDTAAGTPRKGITFRSVLLGSLGALVICGLTPFNDYVVVNTFFIGGYLPLALVLMLFLLVVCLNAPLLRLAPRHAFSTSELAVIILITLISCAFPSQGMMRYLLPMMVGPFHQGATNARFWSIFKQLNLPDWLFPVDKIANGLNHPNINAFTTRLQPEEAIPWLDWMPPLVGWGIFALALVVTLIAIAWIFRRQWALNERLPFPVAQVESALIAPPRPGHALNTLLGNRLFWIGVTGVFILQSFTVLNRYFPKTVPLIPLSYNLAKIMANDPWNFFSWSVKTATIYFTFIGIAYFIQSRISFSLWATFLVAQIVSVQQQTMQNTIPVDAWRDQHFGATLAFLLGILWISRHHLRAVLLQLVGASGSSVLTRQENYRTPALIALGGIALMITWLLVVGVTWWMALAIVGVILVSHLVTARIVAETGLPFVRVDIALAQIFTNFPPALLTGKDLFFSGAMQSLGPIATRESVLTFSQHGLTVCDQAEVDTARLRRRLMAVILWTITLSFTVSAASSLWCYYRFATPLSPRIQHAKINPQGVDRPRTEIAEPMVRQADNYYPTKSYNPAFHFSLGVVLTAALQVLSLRSASSPFLPVGYLLCSSWYISLAWFSLMLGWLAKVLILRFGGASMYQKTRPLFIGLIFGEALAAGVWMIITLLLAFAGYDYQSVTLLPQ